MQTVMETQLDQYTALLYDHKFDVDDVLFALCGDTHQGRWLLHTRNGELVQEPAGAPQTIKDGDDNNHWHEILPLPAGFTSEMLNTPAYTRLSDTEKAEVDTLLAGVKNLADLPPLFEKGYAGGWLRERVKDAALKWLDSRGLIPPSMKHVYRKQHTAVSSVAGAKIVFE